MVDTILLIARWIGEAHEAWLVAFVRRRPLAAENAVLRSRLAAQSEVIALLQARVRRVAPHRRPHFRSWERLAILAHAARRGLSGEATAKLFVLAVQTVINWRDAVRDGVRHLVQAREPINRLPDLVDHLVATLKREWPRWGSRMIAGMLAKMGVEASRASVQRRLRRPPRRRAKAMPSPRAGTLRAKHAGHIVLLDFTRLRGLFRDVVVGIVIDAFSRKILAMRLCAGEPTAAFACVLLREAIVRHGKPRWVITDKGAQFTSRRFGQYLARRGIRRRFGAVGRSNSIALVERVNRSFKQEWGRGLLLFGSIRSIECRALRWASWYNAERPHSSLGFRTPDEVHAGRARRPPRRVEEGALVVTPMHGEHALPILRLRRAA